MSKEFEKDVLRRFDMVIKLLTISSMKDEKQVKKISLLNSSGFSPKEIAEILGTSSNTVSVALHHLKKGKKDTTKDKEIVQKESEEKSNTESNLGEISNEEKSGEE